MSQWLQERIIRIWWIGELVESGWQTAEWLACAQGPPLSASTSLHSIGCAVASPHHGDCLCVVFLTVSDVLKKVGKWQKKYSICWRGVEEQRGATCFGHILYLDAKKGWDTPFKMRMDRRLLTSFTVCGYWNKWKYLQGSGDAPWPPLNPESSSEEPPLWFLWAGQYKIWPGKR